MLALLIGCAPRPNPVFFDVVQEHRVLLVETNDSVITSIKAELNETRDQLTPEQVKSVENLIARLEFLKKQSEIIEQYVLSQISDETLMEFVKYKWDKGFRSDY
jgi:uncharacterized protein with gpF-like domain